MVTQIKKNQNILESYKELYEKNEKKRKEFAEMYRQVNNLKYRLEENIEKQTRILEDLKNSKNKKIQVLVLSLEDFEVDDYKVRELQDFVAGYTPNFEILELDSLEDLNKLKEK